MKLQIVIGPETSADIEAIAEVTRAAFETLEISKQTEPFIMEIYGNLWGLWGQTRLTGLISCLIPFVMPLNRLA